MKPLNAAPAASVAVLEDMRKARESEQRYREGTARLWRDMDMDAARDWKAWGAESGIETSADVARNVRWAREWNHKLVRLKYRKKLQ